ncbi:MAG: AAA family ATPase [Myxococcota bacterium]
MGQHAERLRAAIQAASAGLVGRRELAELVVLSAVAREHLLIIGPPGTAKSAAIRRISAALGGRYFEYLLGRFTEPSELFGPIDLRALREGRVVTETAGMLPEAEIAFLDEIFLGSTAILNTLLGILNERRFRRGHTALPVPLRVCVGASNGLPEEPALAAFADRFMLRIFVDNLPDPQLEALLEGGWSVQNRPMAPLASMKDVDALAERSQKMDLSVVRPDLADCIRALRQVGIHFSDRRAVKAQRLIAAAAAIAGREIPSKQDLWPVVFAVPTQADQAEAKDRLRQILDVAENDNLVAAAGAASAGPAARAALIVALAEPLLAATQRDDRWRLKLEGVAREIDAGFDPSNLPTSLKTLRQEIVLNLSHDPA